MPSCECGLSEWNTKGVDCGLKKIIVDCERNDPVDIRCGGPVTLGFDFFVEDADVEKTLVLIKEQLKENDLPLEGTSICDAPEGAVLSSEQFIIDSIRAGY